MMRFHGSTRLTFSIVFCVALCAHESAAQPETGEASPTPPPAAVEAPQRQPLGESLTGQAKVEYEAGRLLYSNADWAGAILKFQRAYEVSADPRLLWNIAVCEKNQRHYAKVLTLLERYQKEAGSLLSETERQEAGDLVNAVSGFVSPLVVTVNEPGAEIAVDGLVIAKSPMTTPVMLDIGDRVLTVTKPGFVPHEQKMQVVGMTQVRSQVVLKKEQKQGHLAVVAGPGETISVNGKVVAVGRWSGALEAGSYTVRVTAQGKEPYETEAVVREKETKELRVGLRTTTIAPIGSDNTWIWLSAGAVVLAGTAVGGYFLLRPDDPSPPAPVDGTLATVPLPLFGGF